MLNDHATPLSNLWSKLDQFPKDFLIAIDHGTSCFTREQLPRPPLGRSGQGKFLMDFAGADV
jgi:hypothetical protein